MTDADFNIEIAARTVWCESRGEGDDGMVAVASCIVNRHNIGHWFSGKTLAGCCLKPSQFSCWNTNDPNHEAACELSADDPILTFCRQAVQAALDGASPDPVMGATHYYAATIPPPAWVQGAIFTVQIGHHRFYKSVQ